MKIMNNKFSKLLIYSLIILLISSCATILDEQDDLIILDQTELLDVIYGTDIQQKYDIYLPQGRTNETTKVLILVHGGSWVSGDKSDMNFMVDLLKQRFPTYAIVNINYRLASVGNSPFPMQIDDISSVIDDLKSKADNYQITNDYGFIGVSAGAQLSMLFSYKYDEPNDVKMVCSIVGPTNFTDINYVDNPNYTEIASFFESVTGVNYSNNTQYYESISPYHVVNATAPATILFYGDQDELIPTSQGVEMHDKLDALGVINEFTLYENEGHGWTGTNAVDTNLKLNAFIVAHF